MNGLRHTLAKALQVSKTTADQPAPDKDGFIGSVYSNAPHHLQAMLPPGAVARPGGYPANAMAGSPFAGMMPGGIFGAPMNMMPGMPTQGMGLANSPVTPCSTGGSVSVRSTPPVPVGVSSAAGEANNAAQQVAASQAFAASLQAQAQAQSHSPEQDRELEQLRKDLRKANEKSNFFRTQVIALQQQVSSMGTPVMGANAAATMADDLVKLRAELAEERAERQAAQAQLQQAKASRPPNGHDSMGFGASAALQGRLREVEVELAAAKLRIESQESELALLRRELVVAQQQSRTSFGNTVGSLSAPAGNAQAGSPMALNSTTSSFACPASPGSGTYNAPASMSAANSFFNSTGNSIAVPSTSPGSTDKGAASSPGAGLDRSQSYGLPPPLPRPSSMVVPVPRSPGGEPDPLDPTQQPGGRKRAVIVGCDYPGKVGTLRAGVADAQQWARFFMKRCGFTDYDIRLLSDDRALYNQKAQPQRAIATKDNILRALNWLTGCSSPGDQMFFVFCGHGAQLIAEEYAGQRLCEAALVPTDCCDGDDPSIPRVVTDTDMHRALLQAPEGAQVTLMYDSCHGGRPLDRSGLGHLAEYVSRGRVDYEKLRGHPVLPRFLELQQWKQRLIASQHAVGGESHLRCRAMQWSACTNSQFCVELPIDDRPRGVFTYIFISALLKAGPHAPSGQILSEAQQLTADLKGRWRLQQDVQLSLSRLSDHQLPFLRP